MATITSAQSGNFSATTTWIGGVVPVDADSFIIAATHTVVYDVATPVTNGFNDSNISGILQHATPTATVLRMNGRLNILSGGTYHMRPGTKLQFKGTAAESHILYLTEQSGAALIAEGTDGMPSTTLTALANDGSTSFTVASSTGFSAGEWIAIYDNATTQTANAGSTTLRDEGFWVHDVSVNTIYFRQFVGPDTIIISTSGTSLVVANSKLFRVGQKIIFGTTANSNLNVKTISTIDYSTNTITLNSAVIGSVNGLKVYETGSDKIHTSGQKVRKIATIATSTSASTSTTITVADATKFVAGDEIWVEARSECGGTTDGNYNAYSTYIKTVQSVSGNVLTLTGTIGYNVVQGALVSRLTRDIIVEPVTPNTDYYGVFAGLYTTNYTRKCIVKDVYFRNVGSSFGQPEGGVSFRGHFSTNAPPVTLTQTLPALSQQPWVEGITLSSSNSTRDWNGLWAYSARYMQFRSCMVVGIFNSGIGLFYDNGLAAYNCISAGGNAWGMRLEGFVEWGEVAYNYTSRSYYGARIIDYDGNCGAHHHIVDGANEHLVFSCGNTKEFYKFNITGTKMGIYNERNPIVFINSKIKRLSGYPQATNLSRGTSQRGFYHTQIDRGAGATNTVISVENDFEYDQVRQYAYLSERFWDLSENAWSVHNANDVSDYGIGWFDVVYVPSGTIVTASCAIKLPTGYSGSLPYFEARTLQSSVGINKLENSGGNWNTKLGGGETSIRYTSAAIDNWENKSITISAQTFPMYIAIGPHVDNVNASIGYWMKPIEVIFNKNYPTPKSIVANYGPGWEDVAVSSTGILNNVRINGGRIK